MVPPSAQEDLFYVLKKGEILGPFGLDELRSALATGELSERDLIQVDGQPIWQPLSRLLANSEPEAVEALAPGWQSLSRLAWVRLRHDLSEQSLATGAVCLGIGVLVMVLSHWPVLFWLPWFAAAVVAAIALLRRQRAEQALLLLAAIVCLPFLFYVAGPLLLRSAGSVMPVETNTVANIAAPTLESPIVTATPREENTSAAKTKPPVIFAEPLRAEPVEMPATVTPVPEEPDAPASVPVPQPGSESKPSTVPDSGPEEPGLLKRTADFFSALQGKPDKQAATPAPAPASTLPSLPSLPVVEIPVSGSPAETPGDFVQKHSDSFVVVTGRNGSGSGFVCRVGEQTYLFTNIHVIAGMNQAQFTRLNGKTITPGAAHAAKGHDVLRFDLAESDGQPLEAMSDFSNNVRIGDEIVVLGNSGGGGVVTSLPGTIVGLGPDRIEVSAEFIPGNSGSPIVHVKSGKVIGVATYLMKRYEEFSSGTQGSAPAATPAPQSTPPPRPGFNRPPTVQPPAPAKPLEQGSVVVRRFAYRLDSIRTWEPVNWTIFQQESEQMRQISLVTKDVIDFLRAIRTKAQPQFATETLRRPATQWLGTFEQRTSQADRLRSTESFLRALRSMVRSDVTAAEARLRYSYFRDELKSEREVRDRLFDAFDVEAKRLASPSERFTR